MSAVINLVRESHKVWDHQLPHEIAVTSCHDYSLLHQLLTMGVDKYTIIYTKFRQIFNTICILSFLFDFQKQQDDVILYVQLHHRYKREGQ
jgi:hypothetical protein